MAASPWRTSRMISTARWQYGHTATLAPATWGTTRSVPGQRLRSEDEGKGPSLYATLAYKKNKSPLTLSSFLLTSRATGTRHTPAERGDPPRAAPAADRAPGSVPRSNSSRADRWPRFGWR